MGTRTPSASPSASGPIPSASPPMKAPSRGTTAATGAFTASAARTQTRPRPSPATTAATMSMWTVRSRAASSSGRRPGGRDCPSPLGSGDDGTRLAGVDRRGRVRVGLQGLLPALARPDAVGLLDRHDEALSVADRAGPGVAEDALHHGLDVLRRDHALDLELGPQVVGQLRPAVAIRDALLAPRALDLADRQAREPEVEELRADGLEALVAD